MIVRADKLKAGDVILAFDEHHAIETVHPDDGGVRDVWLEDRAGVVRLADDDQVDRIEKA